MINLPNFLPLLLNQIFFSLIFFNNSKKFKLFKFESIHKDLVSFAKEISSYLEIDNHASLTETTIMGNLWWGSNPSYKPTIGVNPNIQSLKIDLDIQSLFICKIFFNHILESFNYETIKVEFEESFSLVNFIEYEFESLIYLIFKEFNYIDSINSFKSLTINRYENNNVFFSEIYPTLRKSFFDVYLKKIHSDISIEINEVISINNVDFFIKNIISSDFSYPKKGYFISFTSWDKGYLPLKSIFELNKLADQIWVPNKFLKTIYIESGILEEKIKVIPLATNTNNLNDLYSISTDYKTKEFNLNDDNNFKFLIISDMSKNTGIDTLLKAYQDVFSLCQNVTLVLIDTSQSKESIFYTESGFNSNKSSINKFLKDKNNKFFLNLIEDFKLKPNNPKITLFSGELMGYDFNYIYEQCNCFVYPFRYDVICNRVLESLSKGLPVIITDNNLSREFCNEENSYLLRNELIDLDIYEIDEIKLAGNRFEFSPDIEHLKFLMKYAYDNPEETKTKGKNAKKYIEENFSWDKTFKLVYENIENLRDKPIFRYEFLEKKEKLDVEINNHIKNKDYEFAELILLNLIVYDISYIYKLSDVLIKQDKYEEALDYLTQILDYEGLSYLLCIMIANCLEKIGDIETSIEYYNKSKDLII